MLAYLLCGIKTWFVARHFGDKPTFSQLFLWPIYLLFVKRKNYEDLSEWRSDS